MGARKGEHRSPATEIKFGQHLSSATEFKETAVFRKDKNVRYRYHKKWRDTHKDRIAAWGKTWQDRLRDAAFDHYGWECVCCGETAPEFLTIDHIAENGAEHRRMFRGPIYRILKKENYPEGYQTLCWNCNAAKSIKGGCPHQQLKLLTINAGG